MGAARGCSSQQRTQHPAPASAQPTYCACAVPALPAALTAAQCSSRQRCCCTCGIRRCAGCHLQGRNNIERIPSGLGGWDGQRSERHRLGKQGLPPTRRLLSATCSTVCGALGLQGPDTRAATRAQTQGQPTSACQALRATLRPPAPAMSDEWPRRFPVNSESIMPAVWPWLTLMLSAQTREGGVATASLKKQQHCLAVAHVSVVCTWREAYIAAANTTKCNARARAQPRSIAQPWARRGLGTRCRCKPQHCMAPLVWAPIPSGQRARQAQHSTTRHRHNTRSQRQYAAADSSAHTAGWPPAQTGSLHPHSARRLPPWHPSCCAGPWAAGS